MSEAELYAIENVREMLSSHGLVIVEAKDVRILMDYYQRVVPWHFKSKEGAFAYGRLWTALHEVGLDSFYA